MDGCAMRNEVTKPESADDRLGLAPARPRLRRSPAAAVFKNSLRLIFPSMLLRYIPRLSILFRQITIGFFVTNETFLSAIPR